MSRALSDIALLRAILANDVLIRGEPAWLVAELCDHLERLLREEPMNAVNAVEARMLTERANDDLEAKTEIVLSFWHKAIRRAATVGRNSVRSSDVDPPRTPIHLAAYSAALDQLRAAGFTVTNVQDGPNESGVEVSW